MVEQCNAESHLTYAECLILTLNAERHYAERHYAECHFAEYHYAERHNAECRFVKCPGAVIQLKIENA